MWIEAHDYCCNVLWPYGVKCIRTPTWAHVFHLGQRPKHVWYDSRKEGMGKGSPNRVILHDRAPLVHQPSTPLVRSRVNMIHTNHTHLRYTQAYHVSAVPRDGPPGCTYILI